MESLFCDVKKVGINILWLESGENFTSNEIFPINFNENITIGRTGAISKHKMKQQ